jgi:hypothetical protein
MNAGHDGVDGNSDSAKKYSISVPALLAVFIDSSAKRQRSEFGEWELRVLQHVLFAFTAPLCPLRVVLFHTNAVLLEARSLIVGDEMDILYCMLFPSHHQNER